MLIALESTGLHFYPRPPRGGRRARPAPTRTSMVFLSTPSARRATFSCFIFVFKYSNFYPRPPRGGRRSIATLYRIPLQFLSTPSARRATHRSCPFRIFSSYFYPRPPRGGRRFSKYLWGCCVEFLSTPSARRATDVRGALAEYIKISIHALREEGDAPEMLF